VSYELDQPDDATAVLHLHTTWRDAPKGLVIHLPWFMNASDVTIDGKAVTVADGAITASPDTHEVRIRWTRVPGTPEMSYQHTVDAYKAEYRQRYEKMLHGD
jgi:hypothetical protein